MNIFLLILRYELKSYLINPNKIIANSLFFIILSSIFIFISQNLANQPLYNEYLALIILFSLTSSSIYFNSDFLKSEFISGNIDQISRKIENFEVFIFAKILAKFITNQMPIIILSPLIINLGQSQLDSYNLVFTLALTSFSINSISCFSGNLSILKSSASICAIITLPLIIPVLILSLDQIILPSKESLTLICAISILSTSLSVLASSKITKITLE